MPHQTDESSADLPPLVIGIDVGGTNTDAVLMRVAGGACAEIKASAKVPSSLDVATGIEKALAALFADNDNDAVSKNNLLPQVKAVFLGTTVFVNALLEGRGIDRVAAVRLCGPSSRSLPPFADFPPSLRDVICAGTWFAAGGLCFDGSEDCCVSEEELEQIASEICKAQPDAVIVSGTFSPANPRQEEHAARILRNLLPSSIRITLSSDAGRLGLLARENSAILNACLAPMAQRAAWNARRALYNAGLSRSALIFFTANDGSAIPLHQAAQSPLRCVACGPTNSLRGAAVLLLSSSSLSSSETSDDVDKIVLDVGGTSTDAGCLVRGRYPRDSNAEARIAGVRCNHRTTDVVSIALGGGSIVSEGGGTMVGPESVGADICSKALCFGGTFCTASCVAVAMGASITSSWDNAATCTGTQEPSHDFDVPPFVETAWNVMQERFSDLVQKTRTDNRPIEVIVVGGGAGLVDARRLSKRLGCLVVKPRFGAVANACGSALALTVGEAETIADLSCKSRESVLLELKAKAKATAGPAAQVIECEEVPLAYLPGRVTRIFVRSVAPLDLFNEEARLCMPPDEEESHVKSALEQYPALRKADPPRVEPSPPNVSNGVWTISEYDAHCLAIGCGLLGCGGGGSTFHGLLQLLEALRQGHPIRVVSAKSIPLDSHVVPCGFMGAPSVHLEMMGGPEQLVAAIRRSLEINPSKASEAYVTISEIGGCNGIMPLMVGGLMDLPVVDADLMGRAFPELQMTTTSIYGISQTPMTASDSFGRCITIHDSKLDGSPVPSDNKYWTERVLRPVCVEFGCSAGLADPVMTGSDLRRVGVLGSLSRARRIGDCVLRSDSAGDAIARVIQQEGGKCVFRGMVSDVKRETTVGFAKGYLTIISDDRVSELTIEFQNEFLIAREKDAEETIRVIGCVPDIISLMDVDTAHPVATEEIRFGFRVCVLLLPITPLLRTEEALKVVGPAAFGLQEPYENILYRGTTGSEEECKSIADM